MEKETLLLPARDPERDRESIALAGRILREGGIVAIPTETVYGLAGNALDPAATGRIYAAKGRPSDNPLIVHIQGMEEWPPLVKEVPPEAKGLAERFWPGPLTIILEKSALVPETTYSWFASPENRAVFLERAAALDRHEQGEELRI